MPRHAFKMFLNPGQAGEYRRRHDEIWPTLAALLKQSGVSNYSIHLDAETDILFAYLERTEGNTMPHTGLSPSVVTHSRVVLLPCSLITSSH